MNVSSMDPTSMTAKRRDMGLEIISLKLGKENKFLVLTLALQDRGLGPIRPLSKVRKWEASFEGQNK